jgi:uncharacterized caspase-like protein
MNAQDHAVVVGISKYGSLKPELEGPERDANAFADWLQSPQGGAVPKSNVTRILSSKFEQHEANRQKDPFLYEPTLSSMSAAFARLMVATARNSSKVPRLGRRLYIYLSGHGITPRVDPVTSTNQSALLPANCMDDVNLDGVSGYAYAEWFRLSHAFAEIVMVMDCCRTDRPDVVPPPITAPIVQGGRPDDVVVFYAWATRWDTRAWEQMLGTPPEKRGVFTFALLEALRSGRTDAEGHLTPQSIVGHVNMRVAELRQNDVQQWPQYFPQNPDRRIILATRDLPAGAVNTTITFAPALFGQQFDLQDGNSFTSLHMHTASATAWALALKPGTYVLARTGAPDRPIVVRPGQTVTEHVNV